MKIGEIAKRSRFSVETIRFYERQGLLSEPSRRESGYRIYQEAVLVRLEFIATAKDLGFTLSQIKELIQLSFDGQTRCEHVRKKAENKLVEIEDKLLSLRQMKQSLQKIVKQCEQRGELEACPLWAGHSGKAK